MRTVVRGFDMNHPDIKDRLLVKNHLAFSFLTHTPIVPGHALICPIRCVATSEELNSEEWQNILDLKALICQMLKKIFNAEGFNFAWNMGEMAGQTVPHFHLHVVPRKSGDAGILQYEPRSFLYRPGSRAISPSVELQQIAELCRNEESDIH
jgi:diadenosine tetraphosphate (Ap4A) HIT family hydrolase